MVITGEDASMVEDVDDDLTRELAFYNQVQRAVLPATMSTSLPHTMWVHNMAEAAARKPGLKGQERGWAAAHQAAIAKSLCNMLHAGAGCSEDGGAEA